MKPILIGIAGPSGAGKSVFCRAALKRYPFVSRLKFDDFFCDEADVDRHPLGYPCWDHPNSIKWDWLVRAWTDLKEGRSTVIPDYSRAENRMVGEKTVEPARVIFVDGYQVLYDDRIRALLDESLFFDLNEEQQIIRRVWRQPNVDKGYVYNVMLPAARAFLMPTKMYAGHVIDAEGTPEEVQAQGYSILDQYFDKLRETEMRDVI